jgi:hypothetical protein
VVNREDVDFPMDEPVDNPIGALDDFPNGGIVDLWNDTPRLRECRQPFYRSNQLLSDKLGVMERIFRNELLYGLDIFNGSASPDQRSILIGCRTDSA